MRRPWKTDDTSTPSSRREASQPQTAKVETVRELYPQKAALLAELEEASDAINRHLSEGGDEATRLRDSLELLNTLIRKDHKLLERMTEATGRAVRELTRIRDRHGLGGLYESSGSPRKQDVARPQQVDQSI